MWYVERGRPSPTAMQGERQTDGVVKLYYVRWESELDARACTSELILSHP